MDSLANSEARMALKSTFGLDKKKYELPGDVYVVRSHRRSYRRKFQPDLSFVVNIPRMLVVILFICVLVKYDIVHYQTERKDVPSNEFKEPYTIVNVGATSSASHEWKLSSLVDNDIEEFSIPAEPMHNNYKYTPKLAILRGADRAKKTTIVFAGLVQNMAMAARLATPKRLQDLGERFEDYRIIVIENDSSDGTASFLKSWAKNDDHVQVLTSKFEFARLKNNADGMNVVRFKRMALIRNMYMAELAMNPIYENMDYLAVIDFDNERGWDLDGVLSSIGLDDLHTEATDNTGEKKIVPLAWDMVCANGRIHEMYGYHYGWEPKGNVSMNHLVTMNETNGDISSKMKKMPIVLPDAHKDMVQIANDGRSFDFVRQVHDVTKKSTHGLNLKSLKANDYSLDDLGIIDKSVDSLLGYVYDQIGTLDTRISFGEDFYGVEGEAFNPRQMAKRLLKHISPPENATSFVFEMAIESLYTQAHELHSSTRKYINEHHHVYPGRFYDSLAFRDATFNKSKFRLHEEFVHLATDEPFFVESCFGGIAIYKMDSMFHCQYNVDADDCEHYSLHECMSRNGHNRFLFNPAMTVDYSCNRWCSQKRMNFVRERPHAQLPPPDETKYI
eukprot:CFRG6221T1